MMEIKKGCRVCIFGGSAWYNVAHVGQASVKYVVLHGYSGIVLFENITDVREG